jgi:hypothetical protein
MAQVGEEVSKKHTVLIEGCYPYKIDQTEIIFQYFGKELGI